MNCLIVYCHPNPNSFNHAILQAVREQLQEMGHSFSVRDLYAQNFNPVLTGAEIADSRKEGIPADVRAEQDAIRAADRVLFIYPLWWSGMPAMLKGYFDRVFGEGFAFRISGLEMEGLLQPRKVLLFTTTGAPEEVFASTGMFTSMKQTIDEAIFLFCGMEVVGHRYLTSVPFLGEEDRRRMLAEVKIFLQEKL